MATIPEALNLAVQHHQAGRLPEAESLCRQILQAQPDHPDVLHLLGVIEHKVGRHDVAIDYISRAIVADPAVAAYHSSIGHAFRAQGRLDEAIAHYRKALALAPADAGVHNNLGNVYTRQRRWEEGVSCFQKALALKPDYAEAYNNWGLLLFEQNRLSEAMACYCEALRLKPDYAEAHYNLGLLLTAHGRLEDAAASYLQALRVKPDYADAHNNLGSVLKDQGKLEQAGAHFRQVLELRPTFAGAQYNLGLVLQEQRKPQEAVAHYRQALALDPDCAGAEDQLMHQLQHLCEWSRFDELVERQRQRIRRSPASMISPFNMLSVPCSPAEQLACACNWAAKRLSRVITLRDRLGFRFTRTAKPMLRLGYLSADFREHAVARLIAELFELHDRAAFEVFAYSYGPDDGGAMRARIARACDRFVDIRADSFEQAAGRIHADGVDILIDLAGYTQGARTEIAALRPAPVQVNWLGYPATMGTEAIDYLITDRFITPPEHASFFSEKLVYLPDCYQVNDRQREIAKKTPTKRKCGLPEDGFVFCCFNNTNKIAAPVFDIWMRLLNEMPGSVLWLLEANSGAAANLRREAKARKVDPERLVFAPKMPPDQHLARQRLADLFLDTLPYNAHVTASDALWAGLPVLTCVGETFASRVAGSLLTAIGLPELITHSLKDYEAVALHLARSPSKLAGLRKRLQKNRLTAPLFDSKRFTGHIEHAYWMMWERYLSGEAPGLIEAPMKGKARR